MKKLMNVSLIALFFVATQAFAAKPIFLGGKTVLNLDTKLSSKTVEVSLKEINRQGISIKLYDKNHTLLLTEQVASKNYSKRFNLQNLEIGSYELVFEDDLQITTQKLDLEKDGAVVDSESTVTLYKPQFKYNNNRLDINCFVGGKDVVVTISDQDGNAIFADKYSNLVVLENRYNLEKLARGNYFVQANIGGRSFDYSVKL